ncbi:MAG: TolC family protein [Usitatibacter sp.]
MRSPLFRFRAVAALLAIACTSAVGLAAEPSLSLAEAQRAAVERSRALDAKRFAVGAAREMAVAAGQLPDPVVSVGVDNLPITGGDKFSLTRDFMTMRRIGVMQEFTRGEKRRLKAERFELAAEKGVAEQAATVAAIQRDTALAWIDAYFAGAAAALVAEERVRGLQELQGSEAAYRAGRVSQADVFATQGAVAMLDDRAAEVERRARSARTILARWVGDDNRALGAKPAFDAIRGGTHLHEELASHPEIVALSKQEEIASSEARLARVAKHPDWTVQLAYSQRGPAYSNMVSFGVSIPLPWDPANRQDREAAAKLLAAEEAGAQRDEMLREHYAAVLAMTEEWESNRSRLARFEREIVPLSVERSEALVASYRGGKGNVNDVLAARRNELEVRLQMLQLEAQTARLWAQLSFLFPEDVK